MQERARIDPFSDDSPDREAIRGDDRELSTAEMASSNRAASDDASLQPGDSDGRQLRTVPAREEASQQQSNITPLLGADEASGFRNRWQGIQAEFVDDPRHAVQDADHLVAQAIQRLAELFADERAELERQWDRGDDISTEDLRVALQHYRSFFLRLLAT